MSASDNPQEQLFDSIFDGREDDALAALSKGANPDRLYFYLHIACEYNRPTIVALLIKYGARVGAITTDGNTALHMACHSNSMPSVRILLEHNCPTELKDRWGNTAADVATLKRYTELAEIIINHKPQPRDPLTTYPSLVQLTNLRQLENWYKLGIQLGLTNEQLQPFKETKDPTRQTLWAAKNANADLDWKQLVEALLYIGAHFAAGTICRDHGGYYDPLAVAAFYGWTDFAKKLLKADHYDPNRRLNNAGETSLSIARKRGHLDLSHFLENVKPTVDGNLKRLNELMKDQNTSGLQYFNMYFAGPSGLGKTTTKKRLMRAMENIESLPKYQRQRQSTFLAESHQVIAVMDETSKGKLSFKVTSNLNEEARLIYNYMCQEKERRESRLSTAEHAEEEGQVNVTQSDQVLSPQSWPHQASNIQSSDHPSNPTEGPLLNEATNHPGTTGTSSQLSELVSSPHSTSNRDKTQVGTATSAPVNQPLYQIIPSVNQAINNQSQDGVFQAVPSTASDLSTSLTDNPPFDKSGDLQPSESLNTGDDIDEDDDLEVVTVDAQKVVQELVQLVGTDDDAKELLDKILINLVDIGGQPGFTEMIPFLTKGLGILLAFFPLGKDLDDLCEISYERSGAKITPYKSTYTIREMLSQLLSSITHHVASDTTTEFLRQTSGANPEVVRRLTNLSKIKPVVALVGTFRDKLEMKAATKVLMKHTEFEECLTNLVTHVIDKDRPKPDLQRAVQQHISHEAFRHKVKEQFEVEIKEKKESVRRISSNFEDLLKHPENEEFFIVDNYKGTDADLDPLRHHLHHVFTSVFKNAKLPVYPAQLLLGVLLRKEYSIVSMDTCIQIGRALNMGERDVQFTVWYLSRFVGALIYHPEIGGWFKKYVICQPQVVFDSISILIVESLMDQHCPGHNSQLEDSERRNWRHKGQFSLETIKKFQSRKKVQEGKLIPVRKLVVLLEHSHLLAKIKTMENNKEKIQYFMPAILDCATQDELRQPPPPDIDTPSPIKITFEPRYVPIGLFSAVISELASKGGEGIMGVTWKLQDYTVKRNHVSFHICDTANNTGNHSVTLISHADCFEIRVIRHEREGHSVHDLCSQVLSTVLLVIREIGRLVEPIIAFDCLCEFHPSDSDNRLRVQPDFKCPKTGHNQKSLSLDQKRWLTKEIESWEDVSLKAFPYWQADSSLSFRWLKNESTVGENNELVIRTAHADHLKGYFTCEVSKSGKLLFSEYHYLKQKEDLALHKVKELVDVVRGAAWDVRADWYSLAIELGLNYDTRKKIEGNYRYDVEVCYRTMMEQWVEQLPLSEDSGSALARLAKALQSTAIHRIDIANEINQKERPISFMSQGAEDDLSKGHQPTTLSAVLDVNQHLKMVRNVTWDLRARWRLLGEELDIPEGTLEVIDRNHRTVELCFTDLLERWMRGEESVFAKAQATIPPATLGALRKALRGQVINRQDYATKVAELVSKPS